jgi:hypothetical protein
MKVQGDAYNNQIKSEIKSFIAKNYLKGNYTQLKDIQEKIQKEFKISEGQVHKLLSDLIDKGKLSTVYDKGKRYYAPPKIPLPIKIGVAMAVITTVFWMILDIFIPSNIVYHYIYLLSGNMHKDPEIINFSTLPFVIYSIVIISVFTFLMVFFTKRYINNKV